MAVLALEIGFVSQYRETGRPAPFIGMGDFHRIEILADQAFAGRGLLDLGDEGVVAAFMDRQQLRKKLPWRGGGLGRLR